MTKKKKTTTCNEEQKGKPEETFTTIYLQLFITNNYLFFIYFYKQLDLTFPDICYDALLNLDHFLETCFWDESLV